MNQLKAEGGGFIDGAEQSRGVDGAGVLVEGTDGLLEKVKGLV